MMFGTEWNEVETPHQSDRYPECYCCGHEIMSEYRWHIDGVYYCEDCAKDVFEEYNDPIEDEEDYT